MREQTQRAQNPGRTVEEWESTFGGSTLSTSRNASVGHVHVIENAPPHMQPTRTEHGPYHGLVLFTSSVDEAEERLEGGELHFGSVRSGDLHVYSRARNEHAHLSRWCRPVSFISVMLAPSVVAQACRALEREYASMTFTDSFKAADPLLRHLVRQLGAEVGNGALDHRLYMEQIMLSAAVHLVRHYTAPVDTRHTASAGMPPDRLRQVKEYVEAHLADDIELADLAAAACYSEYHFCRVFKASTGQSPYQYVVQRRMQEAMRQLQARPHARVASIAQEVGYASPSHFSRAFKKHHGVAPSRCRRKGRR
jgi:AraC family transcriptional regulator